MNERKEPSFDTPISSNPETNEIGNGHEYTGNATIETQPYEKIEFTGAAREYFGIWIVNIILSVCTLGIYSAWAKVRRETYFKNNTRVLGVGLGYHATGGQILKGRLIAGAVLVTVNIVISFDPRFGLATIPIFVFLAPWVLNVSMRFSARMSSYRNIRFNWHGTYWKSLWFLVISPLVGLLSLGLLTPLISKSYYTYFASSHSYGTTKFNASPRVREFYYAYLVGGILPAALLGCTIFLLTIFGRAIGQEYTGSFWPGASLGGIWSTGIVAIYAFIFSMAFIYSVLCRNLMVKSLRLSEVSRFDSKINPFKFIWIYFSNLFLIIISLSLLVPWAKVRMYNYLSNATLIQIKGDLEQFVDQAQATQSSLGEALADFEGVELTV